VIPAVLERTPEHQQSALPATSVMVVVAVNHRPREHDGERDTPDESQPYLRCQLFSGLVIETITGFIMP
jgi:hypothetical protein